MAVPREHLKTRTISSKGQITISAEARHRLGLDEGTTVLEITLDSCIIYLPQNQVLERSIQQARNALERSGLTVEELKASVDEERENRLKERYPDLDD